MDTPPDENCPGCGHPLTRDIHHPTDGCLHGWEHDENGLATVDGCYCDLTRADIYHP